MARIKKILLWLVVLLSFFIGLWVAQDNPQVVDITLLGFSAAPLPLGLWLLVMFTAGIAVGLLASLPLVIKTSAENRRLKKTSV
ncbi:MAG: LapA family protein [Porticoccaceae bacterium]|nr:LapA family protein [Porticoccaceae bacterium]